MNSPPATLNRLKHLWRVTVMRVDNGDKHEIDLDAYWSPDHVLTDGAVRTAAVARAIRNDFKQAGGEGKIPMGHYGKAWPHFAVTEVVLVA